MEAFGYAFRRHSTMKNYYFKYLPFSTADLAWGLHVTAVGQSRVAAHAHYPPAPHPEGCADTDIVIASAKSYINALNKVINSAGRTHPQLGDV